jgi:NAD(P)-dependent dehydrogenase (short-subunit alcohol dehydrogenase family)
MLKRSSTEVVLVTGCSSGIGRAICNLLAASGTTVYGGSRTTCSPSQWTHLPLDITEQDSVDAAVAEVLRRESRLDALVACACMGLAASLEDTDDDEAKRQFDTNFFGTARTIRAVLPAMRKQSSGKIVVIGSIGGLIGLPFVAYYSASKFALDGLVEALRGEVAPFGVQARYLLAGLATIGVLANSALDGTPLVLATLIGLAETALLLLVAFLGGRPWPTTSRVGCVHCSDHNRQPYGEQSTHEYRSNQQPGFDVPVFLSLQALVAILLEHPLIHAALLARHI